MNSTTLTGIVATIPKVRVALDGSDFVRFGLLVDRSECPVRAGVTVKRSKFKIGFWSAWLDLVPVVSS